MTEASSLAHVSVVLLWGEEAPLDSADAKWQKSPAMFSSDMRTMTRISGDRFRAATLKRSDVDVFGLSEAGKVRRENADHFLIASLHKLTRVEQTSLPAGYLDELASEARGYLFLVADGVGGAGRGGKAGEMALHAIVQYVTHTMSLYTRLEPELEPRLLAQLRKSVERSHKVVRAGGQQDFDRQGMSTTLTMVTVVWRSLFSCTSGIAVVIAFAAESLSS